MISVAIAALLATACQGGDGGQAEAPEDEAAAQDETEGTDERATSEGGTIVAAIDADPGSWNPAVTTSGGVHTASEIVFNGLVELDDDLQPVPELAESWEVLDEGQRYEFTLRDDVTWHDGELFTSKDVRFTFEEVLLEFHARTTASMGDALESIETPDEHTVVFNFAFPYSPRLRQLDVTEAPIVPAHLLEDEENLEAAEFNSAPVGTGPFRFVSYESDARIVYETNDDYFRGDLPRAEELILQVIPEQSNQLIALEQGEVDFLWGVPGPDVERITADDAYEALETSRNPGGANCIMTVGFNLERPTLQDVRVREAFAHAVDRQPVVDTILFGLGRTASGVEGVDDGTELRLEYHGFPTLTRYGELLREQLRVVGVELDLEPLEPPVFVETVFTERDFDTNVISYCNGTDPQIGVRRMYDSDQIGPVPFSNAAAYTNGRVDELFDEAQRTVDEDELHSIYEEFTEIVVEQLPYVWLVETEALRVHRAECTGFRPYSLFAEEAACA